MKSQCRWTAFSALVASFLFPVSGPWANAQDEQPGPVPVIELTQEEEDGEQMLFATVTLDDEPVEGVEVTFTVLRTFGGIILGSEGTFDDGTAAVEFPTAISGDASGQFTVVATIPGDKDQPPVSASKSFESKVSPPSTQDFFPSALWSARPLWPLVSVIAVLLLGVWSVYAFVLIQHVKLTH